MREVETVRARWVEKSGRASSRSSSRGNALIVQSSLVERREEGRKGTYLVEGRSEGLIEGLVHSGRDERGKGWYDPR